ncbi:regulatory protein [Sanguibacter gelidistatuariae]|uniref:Regulatory protein RecX n=1 Tax=Sanguibacter gelidistatuariae TaxID=1814289 RepID=A0A1G6NS82_9MICO|nr:regulatory protein RecX [Sanguibacter gelidistatuariae]SDC70578.1 regulatory protein [Sanguibacter gelidistatuariae]
MTPAPPSSPLEQEERARNLALRMLTAAPKSRAQVEERLAAKEVDEAIICRLLDRFEQVGLLDDAELAAMIVRTRFAEKKQSRRAIAQELSRKGIPVHIAAAALDQLDDDDESAAALEIARARLRRTQGLSPDTRIRRALGALGRKGYSSGVAMASIRAALAEEGAVEVDDDARFDAGHDAGRDADGESLGMDASTYDGGL